MGWAGTTRGKEYDTNGRYIDSKMHLIHRRNLKNIQPGSNMARLANVTISLQVEEDGSHFTCDVNQVNQQGCGAYVFRCPTPTCHLAFSRHFCVERRFDTLHGDAIQAGMNYRDHVTLASYPQYRKYRRDSQVQRKRNKKVRKRKNIQRRLQDPIAGIIDMRPEKAGRTAKMKASGRVAGSSRDLMMVEPLSTEVDATGFIRKGRHGSGNEDSAAEKLLATQRTMTTNPVPNKTVSNKAAASTRGQRNPPSVKQLTTTKQTLVSPHPIITSSPNSMPSPYREPRSGDGTRPEHQIYTIKALWDRVRSLGPYNNTMAGPYW